MDWLPICETRTLDFPILVRLWVSLGLGWRERTWSLLGCHLCLRHSLKRATCLEHASLLHLNQDHIWGVQPDLGSWLCRLWDTSQHEQLLRWLRDGPELVLYHGCVCVSDGIAQPVTHPNLLDRGDLLSWGHKADGGTSGPDRNCWLAETHGDGAHRIYGSPYLRMDLTKKKWNPETH